MLISPTVIYEDKDVLAINKPAGLLVHEDGKYETTETVAHWFLEVCPSAKGVGEPALGRSGQPIERSGVVHRLDRETSGVMILAKTNEAYTWLKTQFHDRLVRKEYRALVYGSIKERWGTINRPIGRSQRDFRLRSAQHGAKGLLRPAETNWECLGTGTYLEESFSYLRLLPKTGRTHQLRVHLLAIGRPIVGDELYAPTFIARSNNLGLGRLALHAYSLDLALPDGRTERFVAPVPSELEQVVEIITKT